MISSSDSERGDGDSLVDQIQEEVLKFNRIKRAGHHRGPRSNHPDEQLYREALKEFMFGKFEIASENCKKIIANNPENPEPYFLLANMHEEAGKKRNDSHQLLKAVEFYFFHAYYSPPSIQKWLKVAELSFDLEMYLQSSYCFGRALKINNRSIQISLKRAQALERCQQTKKAINIYKKILDRVNGSIQVCKRYAKLRFRRKQYSKARQILLGCEGYEQNLNLKFMICETYIKQRKFKDLENFMKRHILLQVQEEEEMDSSMKLGNNSEEQQQEKANKSVAFASFIDLQIQFLIMLYLCKLLGPFQNQAAKMEEEEDQPIFNAQLQHFYNEEYSEAKIQKYLIDYYREKYRKMSELMKNPNSIKNNEERTQIMHEYNQLPALYEQLMGELQLQKQLDTKYLTIFLKELIKYPAHQTVKNYLVLSEIFKNKNKMTEAKKILKEATSGPCSDSVQLKIQMNHIKTLLSNEKNETKKKDKSDKTKNKGKNVQRFDKVAAQEEDIYYSDEEGNEKKQSKSKKKEEQFSMDLEEEEHSQQSDSSYVKESSLISRKNRKTKQITKSTKQNILQDSITQKLLNNTKDTLQKILEKLRQSISTKVKQNKSEAYLAIQEWQRDESASQLSEKQQKIVEQRVLKNTYNKIKQCLQFIINIEKSNNSSRRDSSMNSSHLSYKQRHGIFGRNEKKRRNLTRNKINSRITPSHFIRQHAPTILDCLKIIIKFLKQCILLGEFQYILTLTQMFSKSKFFSWHNRNIEFRNLKTQIYEIGVFACLNLNRMQKALFFCRFLINRYPTNNFYLNLVSFVMKVNELNGNKVSLNAMVNKAVIDGLMDEDSSEDRKKFTELQYLLGIQYMENSFFELAIGMFLKVITNVKGKDCVLESNCHLCISTCFLQIASSRTVFNKMDYVNRSAYAFKNYQQAILRQVQHQTSTIKIIGNLQMLFNLSRWYIFVKLYSKSIQYLEQILAKVKKYLIESEDDEEIPELGQFLQIQKKTAYNLMVIYRDIDEHEKAAELASKHFMI